MLRPSLLCLCHFDALDPAHPCYVNLYGVPRDEKHARIFTGCATYGEYLDRLYGAVPRKMVSFDVYPVLSVKPLEPGDAAVFAAPEEQGTHYVPPKGTSNVAVATVARPGAFRLKEDVLSHGVPDLFIVEAVVNDDQNGHFTQEHSIRGMEGTVRHVLARNPYPLL